MEETIDDVVRAPEWAAPTGRCAKPAWRVVALSIGFVALYLALDRLSFIGGLHGIGITPWNPSAGLAMALLIIKGLGYAPLVMAAELWSSATLPIVSLSAVPVFLGSLVVTAGYTGAVAILQRAGFQASMRRSSDVVVMLLVVTIISSGLVAIGFVAPYAAAGVVPWSGFAEAGFHFWIDDAIGIIVLLPLLLLFPLLLCNLPEDCDQRGFNQPEWAPPSTAAGCLWIRRATALCEVAASGDTASATPASGSQRLLAGGRWIRTVGTL
jgi:hypothetical protein